MNKIYTTLFILFITGCNAHPKVDKHKFIAVQDKKIEYGKRYHFIIETPYYSSSPHNLGDILPTLKYRHYHIYVDSITKLSGEKILFSSEDDIKARQLDKNTVFTISKNKIKIEHLKKCDKITKKCWESELNREYIMMPFSQINTSKSSIAYTATTYYYK